jgi:hypothetical protein
MRAPKMNGRASFFFLPGPKKKAVYFAVYRISVRLHAGGSFWGGHQANTQLGTA